LINLGKKKWMKLAYLC